MYFIVLFLKYLIDQQTGSKRKSIENNRREFRSLHRSESNWKKWPLTFENDAPDEYRTVTNKIRSFANTHFYIGKTPLEIHEGFFTVWLSNQCILRGMREILRKIRSELHEYKDSKNSVLEDAEHTVKLEILLDLIRFCSI